MPTPASFPSLATLKSQNAALTRACALLAAALRLNTTSGDDWPECPHAVLERVQKAMAVLPVGGNAHHAVDDLLASDSPNEDHYDQGALLNLYPALQSEAGHSRS